MPVISVGSKNDCSCHLFALKLYFLTVFVNYTAILDVYGFTPNLSFTDHTLTSYFLVFKMTDNEEARCTICLKVDFEDCRACEDCGA